MIATLRRRSLGSTIAEEADAIEREFAALPDWSSKLQYLITLGRTHVGLEPDDCTEATRVHGCQSQLWVKLDEANGIVAVKADSDAAIMRGVLALIVRLFDGRLPGEVAEYLRDRETVLPLLEALAPSRSNGVRLLVSRIRRVAEDLL